MLNTKEAIEKRRSIRKYKPDLIPDEHIAELLDAARLAPSGCNAQPWRFKIVKEAADKKTIYEAAVTVNGRQYRLETSDFVERGKQGVGANKRTAEFAGGGGAFGSIVGAIAGGGKGAAIGALSGAAAGTVAQSATRGKGVRIPAETVLNFRLEAPIRIREMR
jgi:nitroreductase